LLDRDGINTIQHNQGVNRKLVIMTIEPQQLFASHQPRYLAIAEAIAAEIEDGRMAPGNRLPPQRDLAYRLGVTVGTVSRAYRVLARRRLVGGHVGRGTFVSARTAMPAADGDGVIELVRNVPPLPPPEDLVRETFLALAEAPAPESLFAYAVGAGAAPVREAAAAWTRRVGLEASAEQVCIFGGAQQALAAACLAFGGSGALVEALTYPGLLNAAQATRTALFPVALDGEGLSAADLDRAAVASGARLLVLVPTLQNPGNTVMSLERRAAIAEVARRRDFTIVEDDVYGFVIEERPPPIASLAPERTIYLSGVSKWLAPGLRVAWAVAPAALRARLLSTLYAMSLCRPPLTAEIAQRWLESGAAVRLLAAQRRETRARQALAAERLSGFRLAAHPASFHVLMHLPEPWTAEAFASAARGRGVGVVPAAAFAAAPAAAPRTVRVSLTEARDRATLDRALAILAELAGEAPRPAQGII
jgi:DNA-binding transcriptional MocR family regulator